MTSLSRRLRSLSLRSPRACGALVRRCRRSRRRGERVHRRARHRRHRPRADRQRDASSCAAAASSPSARRRSVTCPPAPSASLWPARRVIPGLVNAHGHVGNTVGLEQGHYSAENVLRDLTTYAAYGVTTVFSLGDDQAAGFAARDAQSDADARSRAPVRRRAGAGAEVARRSAQAGRRRRGDEGRHRQDPRRRQPRHARRRWRRRSTRAVIDEAHKKSLRVAVHLFYLEDAKAVLDAGADFIAHSVRDVDGRRRVHRDAEAARRLRTAPTLMREVSTFVYESTPPWFSDPLFLKHADRGDGRRS